MDEVNYSIDDQIRYEAVMGEVLQVKNRCETCPPERSYDGQHVWWGCVGCFEKEEKRLQQQDSARRRDVRGHCSRAKQEITMFVHRENLTNLGEQIWRGMRANLNYRAIGRTGYSIYWWVKDESLLSRAGRTCGRIGRVLDPRKMQEPSQKLGRKAKRVVGAVFDMTKKSVKKNLDGAAEAEGFHPSSTAVVDCIVCCIEDADTSTSTVAQSATSSSHHQQKHQSHIHIPPPRREIRCWRCWRARRSRRRRRYDDGLAYGPPLPKVLWCLGCQAEHDKFVEIKTEKKLKEHEREKGRTREEVVVVVVVEVEKEEEEEEERAETKEKVGENETVEGEEEDIGLELAGLFGEV